MCPSVRDVMGTAEKYLGESDHGGRRADPWCHDQHQGPPERPHANGWRRDLQCRGQYGGYPTLREHGLCQCRANRWRPKHHECDAPGRPDEPRRGCRCRLWNTKKGEPNRSSFHGERRTARKETRGLHVKCPAGDCTRCNGNFAIGSSRR